MNLANKLIEVWNNPEKYPEVVTVNDFFDLVKIPQEDRSDFVFAAIVIQATEAQDENQV